MGKNKHNKHHTNGTPAHPPSPTTTTTTTTPTTNPTTTPLQSSTMTNSRIHMLVAAFVLLAAVILGRFVQQASITSSPSTKPAHDKTSQQQQSTTTTTTHYPPRLSRNEQGEEVPTMHMSYAANGSPSGVFTQTPNNSIQVAFTLHSNGDGSGSGVPIDSRNFQHIDEVIEKYCCQLMNVTDKPHLCAPNSGARLVNDVGVRMMSFADVEEGRRAYCVLQGIHFVWPLVKVGNTVYPKNVVSPNPDQPIKMTQMSNKPRVFRVDNFVAAAEITELLNNNKDRVTRSEVGFYGWQDDTRTSYTSWDFNSPAALAIQKRTFEILGMDVEPQMADAMQVLRYTADGFQGKGEWYKPHVDWFSADGYDGSVPKVDNGTNRFATMFLYLSNVEEGGHTVFPLSTSHEGYDGQQIVHPGTVDTAGYINTGEARAACNESATKALRVSPRAMDAVLFYSQGPDAELDPWSLHGGCPPLKGTKWSANVWIWNRIRPDKSKAKDKPKGMKDKPHPAGMTASFKNKHAKTVVLYWDSLTPTDPSTVNYDEVWKSQPNRLTMQYDLDSGMTRDMNTYDKHVFVAMEKGSNTFVWAKAMDKATVMPGDESVLVEIG